MHPERFNVDTLRLVLAEGWQVAAATRMVSTAYSLVFVLGGVLIIGSLLSLGWTPFVVAAAGAFMLVGPVLLAGFFGIAAAREAGQVPTLGAVGEGFASASAALWALALVCGLLFMIFVTDAAILYAYMLGQTPVWMADLIPASAGVLKFVRWAGVSGFVVALLLYVVSAFSVPLLCERRASLVGAVVLSVRAVFGSPGAALLWAAVLATVIIGSVAILPVLPLTLPWLAYASRALYRRVLPGT